MIIAANVAHKILQFSISEDASIAELAYIISTDEALKQKILGFANLALLNNENVICNRAQHVIEHILGFDQVSHVGFGVAAGSALSAEDGMTSHEIQSFWLHALCCASLAEAISGKVRIGDAKIDLKISYLAGLFHNLGMLLFGQCFGKEYAVLKKWIKLNPRVPVTFLENRLLCREPKLSMLNGGHAQLGALLLEYWGMPEEVCTVAREHHHPNYSGKYWHYVRIILLANRILKRNNNLGDAIPGNISSELLDDLGISVDDFDTVVTAVISKEQELINFANSFSAIPAATRR